MQLRKLASAAMGTLMAGATMASGVLAASTLADFPQPFVMDGAADFVIVIGSGGSAAGIAQDLAGAVNIAARLGGETTTTTGGTTTTSTVLDGAVYRLEADQIGGITDEITFETQGRNPESVALVPKGETGGDKTVDFLNAGKISISGTEYKYKEVVNITNAMNATARWDTSAADSKDNYRKLALQLETAGKNAPRVGIFYTVLFDKNITATNLKGKEVHFLGKKYVVQDVKEDINEIHLAAAGSVTAVTAGDKVTVGTATVEVSNIDITNKKVTFKVGTSSGTIADGSSDTIGGVNIAVKSGSVGEGYTSAGTKTGVAEIIASSTDVVKKIRDGTKYDGDWYGYYRVGTAGTPEGIIEFGLYYNKGHTSSNTLKIGDSIKGPSDLFSIKVAGLEESAGTGTITLNAEAGVAQIDTTDDGTTDHSAIKLSISDASKRFSVPGVAAGYTGDGTTDVAEVYVLPSVEWQIAGETGPSAETWWYLNTSGGWTRMSAAPTLVYTEKTFGSFNFLGPVERSQNSSDAVGTGPRFSTGKENNSMGYLIFTEPATASSVTGQWTLEYNGTGNGLGGGKWNNTITPSVLAAGSYDSDGLGYVGWNTSANQFSGNAGIWLGRSGSSAHVRSDFTSPYGSKLISASSSSIQIEIPKSQRGLRLEFGQPEGTSTSTTGGSTTVAPIKTSVAAVDTDIDTASVTTNLILVGGPCVNKVTAEALGVSYPACGAASTIPENDYLIQLVDNVFGSGKVALIVAGWEADDTTEAAGAVQTFDAQSWGAVMSVNRA